MTTMQKQALKLMAVLNIGAVRIGEQWIWPEDVRQSEYVAASVVGKFQGAAKQ